MSTCVGVVGLSLETTGIAMIATGMGAISGIVLSTLGARGFIVDLMCEGITRKCSTKAEKHAPMMQVARAKLYAVYQHISKAITDSKISDEDFTLITIRDRTLSQHD